MTISFVNSGEIDMTAVSVMGLSAKDSESPIGRFGTGLKYAIAITLRLGGEITIYSGLARYTFTAKTINFRGKEVKQIHLSLNGGPLQPLPFTLDYGQDWLAWQALRELESNARDEKGQSMRGEVSPEAGHTTIWVSCATIEEAYDNLNDYFITGTPLESHHEWEVYHWPKGHPSTKVFYRGVYVGDFEKPSAYCYNFLRGVSLSEDRMISAWMATSFPRQLGWIALEAKNRDYLRTILTTADVMEASAELPSEDFSFADTFHSVIEEYTSEGRANLVNVKHLHYHYKCKKKDELLYAKHEPSVREQALIARTLKVLKRFHPELPDFHFVKDLPNNVLGMVASGKIYISKRAIEMGEGTLLGTMLEEHLHWKLNFDDESREFQNYLIDQLAKLMLDITYLEDTN